MLIISIISIERKKNQCNDNNNINGNDWKKQNPKPINQLPIIPTRNIWCFFMFFLCVFLYLIIMIALSHYYQIFNMRSFFI